MALPTNNTPVSISGLFKKIYAGLKDLLPEGYVFQEKIAQFDSAQKQGESISYSVVLTQENGISFMGPDGASASFADPQSGQVKEAVIKGCESYVSTGITSVTLSRSAKEGEAAYKKASVVRVKANIKAHMRFLEQMHIYGQDTNGIGRVGFFTATWKGVSFTNGTGTLAGTAFTNGCHIATKKILLNPADLASGIWLGSEGMEVRQRVIGAGLEQTGKVVSVDLDNGIVTVDFVPVAATAASSHCLELLGQVSGLSTGLECLGAKGILTRSGTLFGIDNAVYGIWKGSTLAMAEKKLTFAAIMKAITSAANKGLDRDVSVLVSFDSWAGLMTDQAALRKYDSSYSPVEVENGSEAIKFYSVNGAISVIPSRFVRRSDAFIFAEGDWKSVGSSDITMRLPGMDGDSDLLQKPITQNLFIFRSFADKAPICLAPAQSVYISGINPDSVD